MEPTKKWMSAYGGTTIPFLAGASWFAMVALWLVGTYWANKAIGHLVPDSTVGPFIAALASVSALYAAKLFLMNRKDFAGTHIGGIISIVLILGTFDFIGLYGDTGYSDALENARSGVIKTVEDFNFAANDALRKQESEVVQHDIDERARLEQERIAKKAQVDEDARQSLAAAERRAMDADFTAKEEAAGVKTDRTSGIVGSDDLTRARQAEAERKSAEATKAGAELAKWSQAEKVKLDAETATALAALEAHTVARKEALRQAKEGLESLTILESSARGEVRRDDEAATSGIMLGIHEAETLLDLSKAARRANSQMSFVAGALSIESKDATVQSKNVIGMAFSALFALDITAVWTWLLPTVLQSVNLIGAIVAHRRRREDEEEEEVVADRGNGPGGRAILPAPAPAPADLPAESAVAVRIGPLPVPGGGEGPPAAG